MALCSKYVFLFLFGVNLLLSLPLSASSDLSVVAASSKLLQYRENNQLKGPSAEIFKLLMNEAGLPVKIDFMPWSRAYKLASTKANTMILTMVRTAEREDKFHWLLPVSESKRAFVALKSRKDLALVNFSQAKSKLIAVVRDSYGLTSLLKQGFNTSENLYVVADMQTAISLFLKGKVDLLYADPSVLKHYFAARGQNSEDIVIEHIFPETQREGYIAINKHSSPELVEQLKLSAQRVKKNPLYQYYYYYEPLID